MEPVAGQLHGSAAPATRIQQYGLRVSVGECVWWPGWSITTRLRVFETERYALPSNFAGLEASDCKSSLETWLTQNLLDVEAMPECIKWGCVCGCADGTLGWRNAIEHHDRSGTVSSEVTNTCEIDSEKQSGIHCASQIYAYIWRAVGFAKWTHQWAHPHPPGLGIAGRTSTLLAGGNHIPLLGVGRKEITGLNVQASV